MGDSYKEAVVHQAPEVIHVQPGLQPVQPGYEAAPHANLAPAEPRSRRRRFIALVGAGIVVVVVALAVGLGVGLSRSSSSNSSSAGSNTSSPSTQSTSLSISSAKSTTTPTETPTVTSTRPGTSNASPTTTSVYYKKNEYSCPSANNTEIHHVGNSADSSYYIFCDADIHATNKKDLSSTVQSSFADCLGLCNSMNDYQNRADVALTWNFEGTGQQDPGTCWCVTGSSKKVISNPGNMVAVLVSEDVVVEL